MSVAILMLFAEAAGLGFVLMLVIGAIVVVISWLTLDALQDWLGSFGKAEDSHFDGAVAQVMARQTLATGG